LVGRIELVDPSAWSEPVGDVVQRVGGVPVPGGRVGHSVAPAVELDPEVGSTRVTRFRARRQMRSLLNNPLARLRGVWVAWSEDDEQSGWFVPGQTSMPMTGVDATLVSGLVRLDGLQLELVGRPRTHRPGLAVRTRDLRLTRNRKDTLGVSMGRVFEGRVVSVECDPGRPCVAAGERVRCGHVWAGDGDVWRAPCRGVRRRRGSVWVGWRI